MEESFTKPGKETEFDEAEVRVNTETQPIISQIITLIRKCEEISEREGVPFQGISDIFQTYCPESFFEKWEKNLSEDFISDRAYWASDGFGWMHSDIC